MKEYGIITLSERGGTGHAVVPIEVIEWINRNDTPGREGNESGWIDTAAPAFVADAVEQDGGTVRVTIGSYQNDRAIHAYAVAEDTFYNLAEAVKHIQEAGGVLKDSFEGLFY